MTCLLVDEQSLDLGPLGQVHTAEVDHMCSRRQPPRPCSISRAPGHGVLVLVLVLVLGGDTQVCDTLLMSKLTRVCSQRPRPAPVMTALV